jgi:hypothetical protein
VYTPAAGMVLSAGTQTLSTTFTPTDTTDYNTASASVQIVVQRASPQISWTAPSPINYPIALSPLQLDATASVPGTLAYSPAAGQVLTVGSWTLSVTFSPTDNLDYTTATTSVPITVNPGTVSITWNNPADITYGTALSSTQLNATASVAGTFAYNPPAGTILGAGATQPLVALFTPTDPNYSSNSATVYINVNKAAPIIVWQNPADITYGTALSTTQLNAIAMPNYALTGWWRGEGDYTDAIAGNTGTPTGNVTFTTGEIGQALNFPTGSGGIIIPYSATYNIQSPGFTAAVWVNGTTPQPGAQNGLVTLLEKSPDAINFNGWALEANASTGAVQFSIGDGTGFKTVTGTNVLDGKWHLVVGTWDGTAMAVYVDGTASSPLTVTPANNTAGLAIGFDAATNSQNFEGAIDEVQIFNRPLPAGTYTYTPAAGTILGAGSGQTLNVSFNPNDVTDLNSASASVQVNVTKATQIITFGALPIEHHVI